MCLSDERLKREVAAGRKPVGQMTQWVPHHLPSLHKDMRERGLEVHTARDPAQPYIKTYDLVTLDTLNLPPTPSQVLTAEPNRPNKCGVRCVPFTAAGGRHTTLGQLVDLQ